MKHVIYLLLVANAVYFAWNRLHDSNEVARALPLPETVRPLVTLQEMQAAETQSAEVSGIEAVTKAEPPGAGVEVSGKEALTKAESPGTGVVPGCLAIGPFISIMNLQPLKERLGASGLNPRQQTREQQTPVGYWVYLPAMERKAALEIRQVLDDASDSEYYIGKDNLISLGAFKQIERAEIRLEATRKLGLEAVLEPRLNTRITHWLELDAVDESRDRVEGILQEFPGVKMQAAACGSIAVTDTIQ